MKKAFIVALSVLLFACRMQGPHMGPHRMEILTSFEKDSVTYEVYGCYKYQCTYTDTIIAPKP